MYIQRHLLNRLQFALGQFPAVLVTGPRQSGKTTFLVQEFGQQFEYVTFDDPLTREFARRDPNGFLDQAGGHPLILDEIQYAPELLPYLKMRIDRERQRTGRWLLTGSQQFALMKNVSESLAGRIALLERGGNPPDVYYADIAAGISSDNHPWPPLRMCPIRSAHRSAS